MNKKTIKNEHYTQGVFMFRLFAFIISCVGGLNWLMIGALQYDFIAGVFGTQSNVFSRIIYVIIGFCAMYVLIITIFSKGKLKLFNYKKRPQERPQEYEDF